MRLVIDLYDAEVKEICAFLKLHRLAVDGAMPLDKERYFELLSGYGRTDAIPKFRRAVEAELAKGGVSS